MAVELTRLAVGTGAPVRRAAALGDHLLLGSLSHADQPLGKDTADVKGRTGETQLWDAYNIIVFQPYSIHTNVPLLHSRLPRRICSALWHAACHGHLKCVDALLRARANQEEPALGLLNTDVDGESPITIAFKRGHTSMIIELVGVEALMMTSPDNHHCGPIHARFVSLEPAISHFPSHPHFSTIADTVNRKGLR